MYMQFVHTTLYSLHCTQYLNCKHFFAFSPFDTVGAQIVSPMSGEIFRVNETENITFTCVAIGLPPPSISFFNGDQLLGLPRFIVETQPAELLPNTTFLVTASLTLINATNGDSGDEGICRAMNTVEELNEARMDEVSIEVVVNGEWL